VGFFKKPGWFFLAVFFTTTLSYKHVATSVDTLSVFLPDLLILEVIPWSRYFW